MNISERDKKVLIIGGVLAILILLFTFVIEPFFSYRSETKEKIAQKQGMLQKYTTISLNKNKVEELSTKIKKGIVAIDKQFLDGNTEAIAAANLQTLLRSLASSVKGVETIKLKNETITRKMSPINFKSLKVEKSTKIGGITEISVKYSFNSRIRSLLAFLDKIESSEKVLSVRELAIKVVDIRNPRDLSVMMKTSGFIRNSVIKK